MAIWPFIELGFLHIRLPMMNSLEIRGGLRQPSDTHNHYTTTSS